MGGIGFAILNQMVYIDLIEKITFDYLSKDLREVGEIVCEMRK